MSENTLLTGYPSIDKPWQKYYSKEELELREPPKGSMFDSVYSHNKDYLEEIAIEYYGRKISYGEFFQLIEKCSRNLSALGVKYGDIVTVQSLPIPQVIVLMYALNKIGACCNMLYPDAKAADVVASMEKTDSTVFVVVDKLFEQYEKDLPRSFYYTVILLNVAEEMGSVAKLLARKKASYIRSNLFVHSISWVQFMAGNGSDYLINHDENLPAFMLRTGGTTGIPKEVVLTSGNFGAMSQSVYYARMCIGAKSERWERKKKYLLLMPPFIAFCLGNGIHNPLNFGGRLIVTLDISPQATAKMLIKHKPHIVTVGTVQVAQMIKDLEGKRADLSSLEMLGVGGDAISAKLERDINSFLEQHNCKAKISKGYGLTEISASVIIETLYAHRVGTVGIPIALCNMKIVDENSGDELSYDSSGEICLSSPGIMQGYFKDPAATNEIIEEKDGVRWLHTGDIGEISKDGFLSITGRIKRIIVVKEGSVYHKVFPRLNEEAFLRISGIRELSIVGRSNKTTANELIAFFVPENNDDTPMLKEKLCTMANHEFKSFERPVEYISIEEMPRTLIGKVDYRALEEIASERKG